MKIERLTSTNSWTARQPLASIAQSVAWRGLLGLVYLLVVSGLIFASFKHWAYDDPFITYRYAQNLRSGLGFVYNPGQFVLSTTTPLFAALLAFLGNIWPDLPHLANLIGAFSLGFGGLLIWDLAQTWKTPWVGWAGLILYPIFPLLVITLGSEIPLYLALCLLTVVLYARKAYSWTAVAGALAALTRLDGVLIMIPLGLDYLINERLHLKSIFHREATLERLRALLPWNALAWYGGILLAWSVLSWWYFGSPFPATLAAKQSQGTLEISQKFAAGFVTLLESYATRWDYWVAALLALIGFAYLIWKARQWFVIIGWSMLYFAAYALLGVTSYFWYYAPLVPGFVVLVGLGVTAFARILLVSRRVSDPEKLGEDWVRRFGPTMIGFSLLVVFGAAQLANLSQIQKAPDPRYAIYQKIGRWLAENTPESASVGALEIGIIGYYAQRQMIDFAGLLQPAVAAQLVGEQDYAAAARWAFVEYRPDYVVVQEGVFPDLENNFLSKNCNPARRIIGEQYGYSADLAIFACR